MKNLGKLGIVLSFGLLFGLAACGDDDEPAKTDAGTEAGAGGSAQGGSSQGGSAQGGSAQGGSEQGGGGGSEQGGGGGSEQGGAGGGGGSEQGGAGGGSGDECTPTGSVADLRAKIAGLKLGEDKGEDFQLCGVVVTYVNKETGFYLQDPGDRTGIYAHIKIADLPADAKEVGNKLNLKVTKYKKHKKPDDDTGDGIFQITEIENGALKKLDDTVDVATLVQELNVAPTKEYESELVSVKDLEITESKKSGASNWSLKVKYGSEIKTVLFLHGYDDTAPKAFCKGKKIGTYQGPVGYFANKYQLVSDHPADDLKDVTGSCAP